MLYIKSSPCQFFILITLMWDGQPPAEIRSILYIFFLWIVAYILSSFFYKTFIFILISNIVIFGESGLAWSMQMFPGQGWNPLHSSDPSLYSDIAGSLTCCSTRELWQSSSYHLLESFPGSNFSKRHKIKPIWYHFRELRKSERDF